MSSTYSLSDRTFKGTISIYPKSIQQVSIWDYTIKFNSDLKVIEGGQAILKDKNEQVIKTLYLSTDEGKDGYKLSETKPKDKTEEKDD